MPKKALVMIDMQKEWVTPGSEYDLGDVSDVISRVNQLLAHCRSKGYKVIATIHEEPDSEGEFAQGTDRTEPIDGVEIREDDAIIRKEVISCFLNNSMDEELDEVDEVVVCGFLTNLCVRMFVEEAYDRGLDITIIEDCCRAFDDETHELTLEDLKETRDEIKVIALDEFKKG